MRTKPFRREIEELVLRQNVGLELIVFGRFIFLIGRDATAAIHRSAAVGALHVLEVLLLGAFSVVVIEERYVGVVALDQTPARGVIMSGGQGQAGIVLERINGLNQA